MGLKLSERIDFAEALRAAVRAGGGAKIVAAELDVAYSSLMNEISGLEVPDGERVSNRLGFLTFIGVLDAIGAKAARPLLDAIAQRFGGLFVPRLEGDPRKHSLLRVLALANAAEGHLAAQLAQATDPAGPGGAAITRAERELMNQAIYESERYLETLKLGLATAQGARA